MVSSARQAIACILLIFGTVICLQAQTGPAKGPTAVITGKVTLKGKGVSGIVVGLRLEDSSTLRGTRYRAVTDHQGNYRIINVPPGSYQVLASAPAFVSADELARPQTLFINKDESVENIDFALVRGGVITGRVSDSEGRPVIEEEVSVCPKNRTIVSTRRRQVFEQMIVVCIDFLAWHRESTRLLRAMQMLPLSEGRLGLPTA